MDEILLDDILENKAKQEIIPVPESFSKKRNSTIESLPERKKYYKLHKAALQAAMFAVIIITLACSALYIKGSGNKVLANIRNLVYSENLYGERTIRDFVTAFYTVNQDDFDFYQRMMNGAKESELEDFNKSYETNTKKFEQYLSVKSYKDFYPRRLSYLRAYDAYKNNALREIIDLKISKINDDKKAKTIAYHYEVQLKEINRDTKKEKIINKTGPLTVIRENGHWKIIDGISR